MVRQAVRGACVDVWYPFVATQLRQGKTDRLMVRIDQYQHRIADRRWLAFLLLADA